MPTRVRIKARILVPLGLALVLLFAAFLGNTAAMERKETEEKLEQDLHSVQDLLGEILRHDAEEMGLALELLTRDHEIGEALADKDRDRLLRLAGPLFERLQKEYQITHCYFTGADRVNILRVHMPDSHGDRIDRFTTLQAQRTGQRASGIEVGLTGTLTLRTVVPCYDGKKLIGYIEFGKEIDHIARTMAHMLKVDLCFLADKRFVDRKLWDPGMKRLGRSADWDRFGSYVVMECTDGGGEEPTDQILAEASRHAGEPGFQMGWNGREHQVGFLPLIDAAGQKIGQVMVLRDINSITEAHERAEHIVIAVCVLIGAILFALFYAILARIERRLASAYQRVLRESSLREAAQQKHVEDLQNVRDYLQTVIDAIADPIMVLDRQNRILLGNGALRKFVGNTAVGQNCQSVFEGRNAPCASGQDCPLQRVVAAKGPVKLTQAFADLEGRKIIFEIMASPILDDDGEVKHIIASYRDITERQQAEDQLRHGAFHDALTGLANRALLMDRLERCIARSKRRPDYHFAVLFLDLDRFKVINDGLGHLAGDRFLVATARRLEKCLRSSDSVARAGTESTVARVGGDEFTVLLDDLASPNDAARIAERIQKELSAPVEISGNELCSTVSIGIAVNEATTVFADNMLRDADTAMYRAKLLGRARYEVFDKGMHAQATTRLQMENELRKGVEQSQFQVHYQPIVCLQSGVIKGFEALVRWQHPERGLIPPLEFIPLAEESGLIVPLGWQVMHKACSQMRLWQEQFGTQPPLTVSVNLSSRQITRGDFIEQIDRILHETGFDPRCLDLEITESAIIDDTQTTKAMLTQLKQRGIHLHMDDFGTGYSSLSYLHRFPFDVVKIDRSFVMKMTSERENAAIVQTIISLADSLGMKVVAEGVETPDHVAQLRQMNCQFAQGYHFAKPMPPEAAAALLASRQPELTQRQAAA